MYVNYTSVRLFKKCKGGQRGHRWPLAWQEMSWKGRKPVLITPVFFLLDRSSFHPPVNLEK